MAIETFNRYENKFMLTQEQFESLHVALHTYMEPDLYNQSGAFYTISNIYYDTDDHALIRNSISKPKYKEKLRLRAYGAAEEDSIVYLEIKKKITKLVNKRRTAMALRDAYQFLEDQELPEESAYSNAQVMQEIAYFLKRSKLAPKVYLAYDRLAYFDRGDGDLRISFDTNIRTRRTQLRLEAGDFGDGLLQDGIYVMEVKTAKAVPLWLAKLLSEHRIYPVSFSKYGTEYKQFLAQNKKQEANACKTFYSLKHPVKPTYPCTQPYLQS